MKKKTSLADIAKSLGVSKTLVSLVLNNKARENGINEDTEKRVLKKAEELNYRPNQIARGLRTGKSFTLGLIVADISNTFYSKICRAAEDAASKSKYNVIFCSSDEKPKKEEALIEMLRNRQVDGLIIATTRDDFSEFEELQKEGFPFVLVDRYYPEFNTNYVIVENREGSSMVVEHLIAQGYDKIGMLTISPSHISSIVGRKRGYKEALEKHGIPYNPEFVREVPFDDVENSIREEVRKLIMPPNSVNAIFVVNNNLAVATMDCLHEMNLRIPQDVAVVCFDDIPLFKFSYPPITAIAQPIEQIGEKAVEILLEKIKEKGKGIESPPKHEVLPTKLVVRRSCGSFLKDN